MQILPVLDIMNGQVVHGIGGLREQYQAIHSNLTDSADPLSVATAIRRTFHLNSLYVADLDALGGAAPDTSTLERLREEGFELTVDAGTARLAQVSHLFDHGVPHVVVALETLDRPAELESMVQHCGPTGIVFSLDLRKGQPVVQQDSLWDGMRATDIAAAVVAAGVTSLIVLDVHDVGRGQGLTTLELCATLQRRFTDLSVITGGGVRGPDDVTVARQAGVNGLLVASALHDGRLTAADLQPV